MQDGENRGLPVAAALQCLSNGGETRTNCTWGTLENAQRHSIKDGVDVEVERCRSRDRLP